MAWIMLETLAGAANRAHRQLLKWLHIVKDTEESQKSLQGEVPTVEHTGVGWGAVLHPPPKEEKSAGRSYLKERKE